MDYIQLKKDVKSLFKENRSGIRKEMWKTLSVYWIFIITYSVVIFLTLSKDISQKQLSYYVSSYLLGFATKPAGFVFSVCLFRALYLCLPDEAFPGSKAAGRFLNPVILFRSIILGFLMRMLDITGFLMNIVPLVSPVTGDSISTRLFLLLLQLFSMLLSFVFFSIFLPCFIAQGFTVWDSFKSAVKLILRFSEVVRFYLRVLLPVDIFIGFVMLLCFIPIFLFKDYMDKLYFTVIFGALSPMVAITFTTGIWMKVPYYNLCVMEYTDINQCVLQLSEDAIEEYSDEDFEIRTENLIKLRQAREHMQNPSIAVGKSVCIGLKEDGNAVAFDMIKKKEYTLDNWKDIQAVAASADKIFGIKSDGTVIFTDIGHIDTVNDLKDDDLNDAPLWNDVLEVAAGEDHIVALKRNGTVDAIGDNKYDQCEVKKWKDIAKIAVGSWHTAGLRNDGTVVAEGLNEDGQCNVDRWSDIYSIAAGDWHTIGLKTGGTVVATGLYENNQCNVSKWSNITAVACGKNYTLGLGVDGSVVAAGDSSSGLSIVSGWCDIIAISAGDDCAAGLKGDGAVVFTKINLTENLGFPSWTDIKVSN
jgi:hypothetical protein